MVSIDVGSVCIAKGSVNTSIIVTQIIAQVTVLPGFGVCWPVLTSWFQNINSESLF